MLELFHSFYSKCIAFNFKWQWSLSYPSLFVQNIWTVCSIFLFNLAILNFCKTPNFIIKVNNLIKIKWHNWLAKKYQWHVCTGFLSFRSSYDMVYSCYSRFLLFSLSSTFSNVKILSFYRRSLVSKETELSAGFCHWTQSSDFPRKLWDWPFLSLTAFWIL